MCDICMVNWTWQSCLKNKSSRVLKVKQISSAQIKGVESDFRILNYIFSYRCPLSDLRYFKLWQSKVYNIGLQRNRNWKIWVCGKNSIISCFPNRLSSTIGGNGEMDQLYTTSQVSNITRKTKFSHISWHVFQDKIKKCKNRNWRTNKSALIVTFINNFVGHKN